ncbi:hypothetical protein PUATCC27989T_00496 [Phytobacter ursingii]|nr:hypothetical protein PUATCC27989T_00496 [Phytobacter ursingii]
MAKKKWPKLPWFKIPLFGNAVTYLIRSKEEWNAAVEYLGNEPEANDFKAGCTQTFENKEEGQVLYLLGVFNADVATLVHECGHVAFYVCRDVGVPTDASLSSETYCYLLDRMFSHFLPHIQKQTEAFK